MKIWKDIVGYEGLYKVSNEGEVKSVDRMVRGRVGNTVMRSGKELKREVTYQGYERVRLSRFGRTKKFNVHRLVAEVFIGKYPKGKVINHIDENKANNKVENLEYITQKENINHGSSMKKRAASQSVKIKGTNIKTGEVVFYPSMVAAGRESNGYFHDGHISQVIKGKHKHHKGFIWEKVLDNEERK